MKKNENSEGTSTPQGAQPVVKQNPRLGALGGISQLKTIEMPLNEFFILTSLLFINLFLLLISIFHFEMLPKINFINSASPFQLFLATFPIVSILLSFFLLMSLGGGQKKPMVIKTANATPK